VSVSPEIELLVLAELSKRVRSRLAAVKAVVGGGFAAGDKRTYRSVVGDTKLGTVYRSDPDPEWQVVDRDALYAHLRQDRNNVETFAEILDEQAAIHVLREHAPHLLAEIERVDLAAVDAALDRARRGEQVPGVEKVKPEGVLSVRPDKNAGAAIERMVQAGVIAWDGTPVLEAGEVAS
jgi:hypothetical protein